MIHLVISLLLIKIPQTLIHVKGRGELMLQIFHCVGKLPAVIIDLHHILYGFQSHHILIWKPFGIQNLIGRRILVYKAIFMLFLFHMGAFEHL